MTEQQILQKKYNALKQKLIAQRKKSLLTQKFTEMDWADRTMKLDKQYNLFDNADQYMDVLDRLGNVSEAIDALSQALLQIKFRNDRSAMSTAIKYDLIKYIKGSL